MIWCDELAFKAASQAKRDELEQMGIRVKAHKTAERCIRCAAEWGAMLGIAHHSVRWMRFFAFSRQHSPDSRLH